MKPSVTRQPGQVCLVCGEPMPVGELGLTTQIWHVLGRVHLRCKPKVRELSELRAPRK